MSVEEYLTQTIFEESLPVTSRLLSRQLGIHVVDARTHLDSFYRSHQQELVPSYVISGKLKESGILAISIVPDPSTHMTSHKQVEELLSETKQKFDSISSVHIYSLAPAKTHWKISEIISGVESRLAEKFSLEENKDNFEKWGIIKNPEPLPVLGKLNISRQVVKPRENTFQKPVVKAEVKTVEVPKKQQTNGITSKYVSRKQQTQTTSNKSNIFLALSSKNKSQPPEVKSKTEPTTSLYKYVSRKAQAAKPKEKVVISQGGPKEEEIDEEDFETSQQRNAKEAEQRKALENMFDDDNDDFGDDDELDGDRDIKMKEDPISVSTQNDSVPAVSVPSKSEHSDSILEISQFDDQEQNATESKEEPVKEEEQFEKFVDEDGYLVTKKTVNNKPPPGKAPASKPRARISSATETNKKQKTGTKQKQSNLMSFFSKK